MFRSFITLACLCALFLVPACSGGDKEQMLRQLEELERMNRADSVMRNDSLAERLAEYFDSHGTPNERMRAHYILGRTYADMGEAPAAVNAYLDAADAADTTAADCDYRTLSRVYGQMSSVYYYQNLMEDYLECLDYAVAYAWKDKDTAQALNETAHKILAYNRLKQHEQAIVLFDEIYEQLQKFFGEVTAAQFCPLVFNSLIEMLQLEKAAYYLKEYEAKSTFFVLPRQISKGREAYYYYKGKYYLALQQIDSALYYFTKELHDGTDFANQSMASRGLSLAYLQSHQSDSAAKYATYSYEMNDSVYAEMSTVEVKHIQSMYNYSNYQRKSWKDRQEAEAKKRQNNILVIVLFAFAFTVVLFSRSIKKKRQAEARKYVELLDKLVHMQEELENLRTLRSEVQTLRLRESELNRIIERKESEIVGVHHEMASLLELEKSYNEKIQEQETLIARLREEFGNSQYDVLSMKNGSEQALFNSSAYKTLHYKLDSAKILIHSDWEELNKLVSDTLPRFYALLLHSNYSKGSKKYRICLLLRLNVSSKSIAYLLGVTPSDISKLSAKILKELFNEDGSGRELSKKLVAIS